MGASVLKVKGQRARVGRDAVTCHERARIPPRITRWETGPLEYNADRTTYRQGFRPVTPVHAAFQMHG